MDQILLENNDSKTKFAIFVASFIFMVSQVGTNYVANLIPFGVDVTALAPRYINIVRGQLICAIIGGWCMVPWKVLVSGTVFIECVTGMGIFMGDLVGIMLADYFFVRKGNYFIEDLYTSDPNGRYWYFNGFHWRAYAAYAVGIVLPFPGFIGVLSGAKSLSGVLNPASQIYALGYLTSFLSSMFVYTVLCKISPPKHVDEARSMPFESMAQKEVLAGHEAHDAYDSGSQGEVQETKVDIGPKK
jgi:NCS1 family nucleobase:cation symporter-1